MSSVGSGGAINSFNNSLITSNKATTIRTLTRRAQLVCDSPDNLQDETDYLNNQLRSSCHEHKRATRDGDVNNHIAQHHLQTKHQIDLDSATCTAYSTDYYQLLTLESWFPNLEQTLLNRSQQLAAPYK